MKAIGIVIAGLLALGTSAATAQNYPSRGIRLVVPFVPGGATDVTARLYAQEMQSRLGQSVIIENRPGGNGIVGTDAVARSQPDGYTLLFAYPGALTVNPSLYDKLPYDPVKDFEPVSLLVNYSFILSVNPNVPAKNVKEFIALAKAQPGKLSYGSAGVGTTSHLTMELFRYEAGVDLLHVPFKGAGQISTELMAGRLSASFENTATALISINSGKIRALGVTSTKRSPQAPDIPTIAESGLPNYNVTGWFAVMAPTGTPKDIIAKLSTELAAITKDPQVNAQLLKRGMEPVGGGPAELRALISEELPRWAKVIKAAGIKLSE